MSQLLISYSDKYDVYSVDTFCVGHRYYQVDVYDPACKYERNEMKFGQ